jgi:tetratricopeptide (TPR) repeat protein
MRVRGFGPALALVATLGLLGASSASHADVVLSADQTRNLAFTQMQAGQFQAALDLTDVLLARDPEDVGALIVRAQALRGLDRLAEAEAAARKAFALAQTQVLRYGASLAMAQVMARQDHWTWAQIWLRRASQYATTEEQRKRVASDYRYVRSQNPLNLRFDFSIQPSDNVNNGSLHAIWDFLGLPFELPGEAQALSGVTIGAGIAGSYVLDQNQVTRDALLFSASTSEVLLSPEARELAPDVSNADYSRYGLAFGYEHRALLSPQGLIGTTTLMATKQWYGGAPLANILSLGLDATAPLATRVQGFGRVGLTYNDRQDDPIYTSTLASFSGGWGQLLRNGDSLRVEAGVVRTVSEDIGTDSGGVNLALDFTHAAPVAGAQWSAGVSALKADWADSLYDDALTGQGRHDLQLVAEVSALLTSVTVYGYSPVVTFSYSTNSSNIDLYDSRSLGVGISIRSRF